MRMLIMEGDGQIRRLLEQFLAQKGHEVESDADGLRGWDLFHFNPGRFDSLLVNAKMPRLTGIELLRRVPEKDADLPAAVSCNYGRLERVLPALELNLRAVLPLPFQLNQLDEVLERLTPKSPKEWKEELVGLMKTTLECWKQEGMETGSLVRHSKIWEMKSKSAKRTLLQPGTLLQPAHAAASHPLGKGRGQRRVRHPELRNQSELPGTRHPRPSVPPEPYPNSDEIVSNIQYGLNPPETSHA